MKSAKRTEVLRQAWLGDAVLALFVRRWILAQFGVIDGERAARMTSNQFLSSVGNTALGNADEVEAHIGRLYERGGLDAAFQWIEAVLMPLFLRQETKRQKRIGGPRVAAAEPSQS